MGHLQRKVRTGFAAVNVVHVEVLARRKLVLVAAAYLASPIVRGQPVVGAPPPLRCLQKGWRGDEPCRPAIRVALAPQKPDEERKAEEQKRRKQVLLDHITGQ